MNLSGQTGKWLAGLVVVVVGVVVGVGTGGALLTRAVDDRRPQDRSVAASLPEDPNIPVGCEDRRPAGVDPGSYGMQNDGSFLHPSLTYVNEEEQHPFPGGGEDLFPATDDYDPNTYKSDNVTVEAHYPGKQFTPDPFHSWQNIVDFDGRRYMLQYDRSEARVYDITDVKNVQVVESLTRDDVAAAEGNNEAVDSKDWDAHDMWGASTIQWSEKYDGYIMVQSFEMRRQVPFWMGDTPEKSKYASPQGVAAARADTQLKGFKIYKLNGPRKNDWELLETVSTDETQQNPLAPDFSKPQQGSGSLDVPHWDGGRYMFISTAPSDDWSLQEYPTYLYANGFQAWDMADPAAPKLLDTWHRDGMVRGEEDAYRSNPLWKPDIVDGFAQPALHPHPHRRGRQVRIRGNGRFRYVDHRHLRPHEPARGRPSGYPAVGVGHRGRQRRRLPVRKDRHGLPERLPPVRGLLRTVQRHLPGGLLRSRAPTNRRQASSTDTAGRCHGDRFLPARR
ncbi:hypothetical protein M2405_004058 [Rhodococcus erythropolis]|nr:hypothetical protein [Rhodococcus erythropolis]MCS4255755.1 hypothetical protein [Rhodococcus erythropolis]MCW2425270.1 hypothetical protein [Rhodococcus erythropolis]